MSDEKEYIVVLQKGVDSTRFHERMLELQGRDGIPNRQVEVANERPASARLTHYYLTDAEVNVLRLNEDVLAVEVPYWKDPNIELGHSGVGSDPERTYKKYNTITEFSAGEGYPWQFPLAGGITNKAEPWNLQSDGSWTSTYTGTYEYSADGEGVDVIIQDTGIDADNYEFQDANGVSRVNKIDWATVTGIGTSISSLNDYYRDYDGHGTHVASTAVGKSMGYARGAQIYAQKLQFGAMGTNFPGLNEYTDYADCFDQIKIFHRNKAVDSNGNKRPTIVNMSWGGTYTVRSDYISSINYRGSVYSSEADLRPNNDVRLDHDHRNLHYGVSYSFVDSDTNVEGGLNYSYNIVKIPAWSLSMVTDLEELIDEGVHVVIAAGNSNEYITHDTHVDWNNTITFATPSPAPATPWPFVTSGTYYLHRGGVHHPNAFIVGNLALSYRKTFQVGDTRMTGPYRKALYSSSGRGPGVDLWHPGQAILGASSRSGPFVGIGVTIPVNKFVYQGATEITHPLDAAEGLLKLTGTSMAAPGVTGILSCILEKNPGLTPAQLKAFVADSSNNATIEDAIQEGYPAEDAYKEVSVPSLNLESGWRSHFGGAGGGLMGGPNRIAYQQYNSLSSYSVATTTNNVNEGDALTFNVTTANVADATTLYWTVTSASDFATSSGSFTITSNTGSFAVTPTLDAISEGTETFTAQIRTGGIGGTIVATSAIITINDTSTTPLPIYSVAPTTNNVNEGDALTFNVTTANVADATTLYWTVTNASDFATSSGSFTITSNTGSFSVTPTLDAITEGAETFTASVRTGGVGGTIVGTSATVTINDTSTTPPTYSISLPSASITVGTPVTVTITTTNVADGTILYWEATPTSSFQTTSVASGQVTITSNTGSFILAAISSTATSGVLAIRSGSAAGTVVATSSFTIAPAAPAPVVPAAPTSGPTAPSVGRPYTTRRTSIIEALVAKLKEIDGNGGFLVNLYNNVHPRLKFWDEVTEFPAVHLSAGSETREYQGGGYRDRFLSITIRCYVNEEDATIALDKLLEDIETVLDINSQLTYLDKQNNTQKTHQISIISIDTDEGVLEPLGVGEILIEVRY